MLNIQQILEDKYLNFDDVISISNMNSKMSPVDVFWNKVVGKKPMELKYVHLMSTKSLAKAIGGKVVTGELFFHPEFQYIVADFDIFVKNEIPVIVCDSLNEVNTARLCFAMMVLGKPSGGLIFPKDGKYQYIKFDNNSLKALIGELLLKQAVHFWDFHLKELNIPSARNEKDQRRINELKSLIEDQQSRPSGETAFLAFSQYHNI